MIRYFLFFCCFLVGISTTVSAQSIEEMRSVLRERLSVAAEEHNVDPELYENIIEGLTQQAIGSEVGVEHMRDVRSITVDDNSCEYCVFFEALGFGAKKWWFVVLGLLSMPLIFLLVHVRGAHKNLQNIQ